MRVFVQVVGIGSGDSSPALLVATDAYRYLFNAGEGLQRFCMEHRVRMARVDGVFLTRVCNETVGGLPGAHIWLLLNATAHQLQRGDRDSRFPTTILASGTTLQG